jgi:type I restriction enzyme R subunit
MVIDALAEEFEQQTRQKAKTVIVSAEAHRSQYDFIDGFAKHMRDALPKASFIGFTGTPIESGDKNTQAVFGDLASQARHQFVS